ncbi:MAG: endonuclease/exonuclease/phosphatase family protein [Desulfosudaceae bacterium]
MGLRIATYNIHRARGHDGREDGQRIAEVLRELNADLIALQEVGYNSDAPHNLLACLGGSIQADVIEGITMYNEQGHYGNAVLSRVPIPGIIRHDISVPGREPRGAIELAIAAQGIEIQVIATHLGLRPGERRYQTRKLLALLTASKADVKILLGDLNEWFLWGRPMRWLKSEFGRPPRPATFPARGPLFALDCIWVHPCRILENLHVHNSPMARAASDHLPLTADIKLDLR